MNSSLIIRLAQNNELDIICNLHSRSVKYSAKKFYTVEQINVWACSNPEKYRYYFESNQLFIAELDNQIIGFGIIYYKEKEICALYLAPEYMGKGYGKRILNHLEEKAIEAGISKLSLDSSLNSQNFYLRNGYKPQKESMIMFKGIGVNCILMTKSLNIVKK